MGDLPIIAIRFALYADLMVLAGLAAFSLYALTAEERASGILPLTTPALALSLAGLLLSGFGMLVLVATMTGSGVLAIDREVLREVVGETAIGTAWVVRMAAVSAAAASAMALKRFPQASRVTLLVSVSLAIATLVWTGHAGATGGWTGTVHRVSDIVHMLAAAVWIGGIAALAMLVFRPLKSQSAIQLRIVHRALEQFSRVGTVAVGLIVASGIVNSLVLLGLPSPHTMLASLYGRLLLAKLALFGAMLLLAAANRWILTPAFGRAVADTEPAPSVRGLRRNLLLEGAAAMAILALVAWLGTLEPLGGAG